MFEVHAANAVQYLRTRGQIDSGQPIEVRELAGGVSNIVLLITLPARGAAFVLKQARGRLRVKDDWRCPVERIWREIETLEVCGQLLKSGRTSAENEMQATVPEVLWQDRENYLYAMTAAAPGHRTWKELLFEGAGSVHSTIARTSGQMLAAIHAGSWGNAKLAAQFADRTYFDQLRLDPYYRQVARAHPDCAEPIDRLLASLDENRLCLVHGDYSPKNLLVWEGRVMLIDFEVGHFGDPAFDLGFFLTHLALKSVWAGTSGPAYLAIAGGFWAAYFEHLPPSVPHAEGAALAQRSLVNLAACLLARIDGKSPVDYLAAENRAFVRQLAKSWLKQPPASCEEALLRLRGAMK